MTRYRADIRTYHLPDNERMRFATVASKPVTIVFIEAYLIAADVMIN